MKVLITGHMGTLGRAFAHRLNSEDTEIHCCDTKSGTDCRTVFQESDQHYDLVLHCARPDVVTDLAALNMEFFGWMDRTKPNLVAFFSSTVVYPLSLRGEPRRLSEYDSDWRASVEYAAMEQMALDRGAFVFRPFEVYGETANGIFNQLLTLVASRDQDIELKGCGRVRDYIHVDDVVEMALTCIKEDFHPGPINLCTGEPTAVDELAELMFDRLDWRPRKVRCALDDERDFLCGNPSLVSTLVKPKISLLDGIRRHVR